MINVLLADDHDLMRQGIRRLLDSHDNLKVCGEAKNGLEAVDKALEYKPDVVIIDLSMPKMGGLEATRRIRQQLPETEVLIFTIHDHDSAVRDVLNAGAHAYILKTDD